MVKKALNPLCHLDAFRPNTQKHISLPFIGSAAWGENFILICGKGDKPCRMYSAKKVRISFGVNGVNCPE